MTATQPLYHSLSDLTDDVVDRLYNIDSATPHATPTFLFLVGASGAGKSSGHARAIAAGLLPATAYATLNLDILLEALAPFRAASSMAHLLKKSDKTRDLTKFASIAAYQTRKENLGLFKWYNTAHAELAAADPETIAAFNTVRAQFADLTDREADTRLLDLHTAALERAIARRVPIVYETTLSLNKSSGRVEKVDDIMAILPTEYTPVIWHITADDLPARVRARQEKQMPATPLPYYRYIPTAALAKLEEATADAFTHIRDSSKYATIRKRLDTFAEIENPFNTDRLAALPSPPPFAEQRSRIVAAYGTGITAVTPLTPLTPNLSEKYRPTNRTKTQKRSRKAASPPRTGGASAAPLNRNIVNLTELLKGLTVAAPPVRNKPTVLNIKNHPASSPPPEVVATMENLIRRVEAMNLATNKKNRIAPMARTRTTQNASRKASTTGAAASAPSAFSLVASLLKKK